jgi:short-subunit dehydrogenase
MVHNTEQYALITGAGSGIGKATALAFAKVGINLVLVGRTRSKLEAVATAAETKGISAQVHSLDLAQVQQVCDRIAAIVQSLPHLDILVNNAGMGYTNPLSDTSLQDWQRVIDLNLTSVFQCIQGVLPTMRRQQGGSIINVTSIAAHQTFPNWGAYCVSKHGLMALSKALAQEERPYGIRVMTVSPGSVNTPLWDTETVEADFDRNAMLSPEMVAESIRHVALMPAAAVVEDLVLMPNVGQF